MAATAGPSSEGPDDDAVVDETTLRFILVRALSARSKPRDPTPVSDAYRGAARRAPGARAAGESNPPILPDAQNRFFRSSSFVVESSNDSSVSRPSTSASLPRR
jgi:hypothetical protein